MAASAARAASPVNRPAACARGQVEDHVADRHAARGACAARRREHAERQVLEREVRVAVGRGHPAPELGSWVSSICAMAAASHLAPVRVEVLLQALAVAAVVLLQLGEPGRVGRDALREAGLEHERHGAFELVRLQLGVAGALEGVHVRPVRQHGVVQREAAGHEAPPGLASYAP